MVYGYTQSMPYKDKVKQREAMREINRKARERKRKELELLRHRIEHFCKEHKIKELLSKAMEFKIAYDCSVEDAIKMVLKEVKTE